MLVLVLSISVLTACGGKEEDVDETGTSNEDVEGVSDETSDEEVEEVVDLGGIEVTIGDWWSPDEPEPPKTQQEEDTLLYQQQIQEKHNFTIKRVAISDWGGMEELFTTSVMADDPAADMFVLMGGWTAQPLANGMLYDIASLDNFDLTESKWNQNTIELMTYGDSVYGHSIGRSSPTTGVFWNKRMFEEAGIDPELPYDLQASGEWTWEEFEKLADALTRDIDNDGTIDTYALASFSVDMFTAILTSNNARFVGKDEAGNYYNATTEPQFLEASQWAVSLIEAGYEKKAEEGSNWDWFVSAFHDAQVAMTFADQSKVGTWADMTDDWGFVNQPKPSVDHPYRTYVNDNIIVMPATFDKETAEKIAFAYDLFTDPTPGYEDDANAWKENYYPNFRDARAVDETLEILYDSSQTEIVNDYERFVYGTDGGADYIWGVYALDATPAERIEEISAKWASLIDDANR